MPGPADSPAPDLDALRTALARYGVTLLAEPPATIEKDPSVEEIASLLAALASSGNARLKGAIPCLLAAVPPEVARAAVERAAAGHPSLRPALGLLYRLARALVISRDLDLRRLFGRATPLPPSRIEPADLPDPSEQFGEMTLWKAPEPAGDAEDLFDAWLRLRTVETAHGRT